MITDKEFEIFITNSQVVGDIDFHMVYKYADASRTVFFLKPADIVTAFVILDGHDLVEVKNISGVGGQITALIAFITHHMRHNVIIPSTEKLNPHVLQWLSQFLEANGRGITITTEPPDRVILESHMTRKFKTIAEDGKLLMSTMWVIGSTYLL